MSEEKGLQIEEETKRALKAVYQPQVFVKMKNGDCTVFNVNGFNEFQDLVEEVNRWFSVWMYIGKEAAVRKDDICGIYYYPRGYANRSTMI